MNAERLHAIANSIREDLQATQSVKLLEQLTAMLQNQIANPAEPSYQKQVGELRKRLIEALRNAPSNGFPPTWKQALEDLGVESRFGSALADQVEEIFSRNQITPTVARDELVQIHKQIKDFEDTIAQVRKALANLKIGTEDLPPGLAELGLLIPRDFVNNKLDQFAKELREDDKIFGVFAELTTGTRPGFPIRSISSSDLSIFLDLMNSKTAACIALAVSSLISSYKKILEIRRLKRDLQDQGLTEQSLEAINNHAEGLMEAGIAESVEKILNDFYQDTGDGRKNELKIELTYSMRNIAARIDRGFNVEVRMTPSAKATEDADSQSNAKYEQIVSDLAPALQFLKREGPPILSLPERPENDATEIEENVEEQEPKKPKKK